MLTELEHKAVIEKTQELCQTILTQPGMAQMGERIKAFKEDTQATADYHALVTLGQTLQEKQQRSVPLTDTEIADFEAKREGVLGNPVARAFLDAQEDMHQLRHSITKFVSMALETGQVPTLEDFQQASCGHGCNCSH